ncbi:MAG: transcription elongation factor GreA [Planctomycetes bacterium]|nr:transcription elongation factor GreA [Planctomycetota bacterium]
MQNYMTRKQYDRHLEATKRTEEKLNVARKKVGEAASHGDLSENAEYDAAVEESGFLAGRVEEMKALFVGVQIVEPRNTAEGMITIGKTVSLRNHQTNEVVLYHVVGGGSVDTDNGEISFFAPLGKALIGRKTGEKVVVDLPGGKVTYDVLSIAFSESV